MLHMIQRDVEHIRRIVGIVGRNARVLVVEQDVQPVIPIMIYKHRGHGESEDCRLNRRDDEVSRTMSRSGTMNSTWRWQTFVYMVDQVPQ